MYLTHILTRSMSAVLRNLPVNLPVGLRVTSLMAISNTRNFRTSPSLDAADAQPFSQMQGLLHPSLLKGVSSMGFENMTPVQSQVLRDLRPLKSDCLVQAKTGTGKTIAFLLPAIQTLVQSPPPRGHISTLILSPTRELAIQIAEEATRLLVDFQPSIEVHTAFGGTKRASSLETFKNGDPKILVATPGRLNDYLSEPNARGKFQSMQTLILDEADVMLNAGFLPDVIGILQQLPPKDVKKWQGMCFSATIPNRIKEVLSIVLNKDHAMISTIDSSEPPTLARVNQNFIIIPSVKDTFNALYSLVSLEASESKDNVKIIIFGSTAKLVKLYCSLFQNQTRFEVNELHSRLTPSARDRVTAKFKDADRGVLFATDVVGRGMDFPNVTHVVQVGLPMYTDAYTHRVGRTARAGKDGRSTILLTEAESFFIHENNQFPITIHPRSADILQDKAAAGQVSQAMEMIDEQSKEGAYKAYVGYMKGFVKKLNTSKEGIVRMANELALKGMSLPEIPKVETRLIGKWGMKGVAGLQVRKNRKMKTKPPGEVEEDD